MSDSTAPGYLAPLSVDPPEADDDLDAIVQAWARDMTGLPGNLVRPRWQPNPPPSPPQETDWLALGLTNEAWDEWTYIGQLDDDTAQLQAHETLEYLLTFYGPNCSRLAGRVRNGSMVTQNRDFIEAHGLKIMGFGPVTNGPVLANSVYRGRADLSVEFRRQVNTLLPIKSLLSAGIQTHNDPA